MPVGGTDCCFQGQKMRGREWKVDFSGGKNGLRGICTWTGYFMRMDAFVASGNKKAGLGGRESLSDTKLPKNSPQDIGIHINITGDLPDVAQRFFDIFRQQIAGNMQFQPLLHLCQCPK